MRTIWVRSCFKVEKVKVGLPLSVIASSWMPTSRCRCACAAGTARPAATRTIAAKTPTRLRNDRLPSEARKHAAQTFLELDLRLPVEQLASTSDVRLPNLWIVDGQRLVHDLALRSGDANHRLGKLVERELRRVAEIHRQVLAGLGQQHQSADQIVDVAEATGLTAVSEHSEGLALES